ncbi:putative ATP-dependent helicase DinG [Luteitalea sp. TBR-22]|uniref:ATP-dependent DNA helicase n=1 Tax=Luteitalea sp. TBR-22 TaxID=2802971 RepID=UPI001AF8E100|nr:ATP-dependent DNA helicase [Luteitalea sp. TBR-22]BCS35605.1 putative ATP-dependent helicase DinG [Luteitalea sp. TBR-22]
MRRALGPGGALATVLDGFEPRESQQQMAEAVARVVGDGGVLLAEAGTGTGKTLAYLVPAILSGRKVLVSTGTRNLQQQLIDKDIPLLQKALGPFRATCMKGRGNYLCLHRFEQALTDDRPRDDETRVAMALIEHWAPRTQTGDRAELSDLPEELPFWHGIAATTDNCLGSECPRYTDCFVTRMRQEAADADVVIVNHHLLCADAAVRRHTFGAVIPECQVGIVDEAHQLEDVATQYFGVAVSNYRVEQLFTDAAAIRTSPLFVPAQEAEAVARAIERLATASRAFFLDLQTRRPGVRQGGAPEPGATLFDERLRVTGEALAEAAGESGLELLGALSALEEALALLKDAPEDLRALAKRAGEVRDDLRFLLRAEAEEYVYFLELRGRQVALRAAPIDVSHIIRDVLIDRLPSLVLTSATLSIGGSFAYARARLGIGEALEVRVPSEFDYRTQALVYLPRRMPDPRTREYAEAFAAEAERLLTASEGRAFLLFTSYAALRDAHARLSTRLPYPMLVQGTMPRGVLIDQFRKTSNAVLFGTSSFWQGVDVVGEALSCVIIDRIPFASPGDPVVAARIEALQRRGIDAFAGFQVPLAILTLLQGVGRLIRHRQDRGVIALLDPRLQSMGYGRRFLNALPPAPVTRRPEEVVKFFQG